ncbi:hypothetical protein [Pedobacter steynii]
MKNLFKFGFLALAMSLSVAACTSEKKADATDSTMTDTSMTATDTMATDTAAMDTTVTDSIKK